MSRTPAPGRPRSPALVGRRAVLRTAGLGGAALALAALTGCATPWGELRVQPLDGDPAPAPVEPDADELARRAALGRAQGLSDAVSAASGTGTEGVAALLVALTTTLAEQRTALGEVAGDPSAGAGGTSAGTDGDGTAEATGGASPTPTVTPSAVPAGDAALVQGFADAGSSALADLTAVSPPMARLLAALAAGHLVAATALARAAALPAPVDLAAGTAQEDTAQGDTSQEDGTAEDDAPQNDEAQSDGAQSDAAQSDAAQDGTAQDDAGTAALATALDAEGAAVYGYGVLAVHLTGGERTAALAALALHDAAADALETRISATGTTPDPPSGAYALPAPVTDRPSALTLAVALEDGGCAAWADLVEASAEDDRASAAEVLRRRALAADTWRATAGTAAELPALPGLSGR